MLRLYKLYEHLDEQERLETEIVAVFYGQWIAVRTRVEAIPVSERKTYVILALQQGRVMGYWNAQSWLAEEPFSAPPPFPLTPIPTVGGYYAQN